MDKNAIRKECDEILASFGDVEFRPSGWYAPAPMRSDGYIDMVYIAPPGADRVEIDKNGRGYGTPRHIESDVPDEISALYWLRHNMFGNNTEKLEKLLRRLKRST